MNKKKKVVSNLSFGSIGETGAGRTKYRVEEDFRLDVPDVCVSLPGPHPHFKKMDNNRSSGKFCGFFDIFLIHKCQIPSGILE